MLAMIIILWILWRLCRPWYGNWHRPPMGCHHYRHHAPMWHHYTPMSGFHGGGFGGMGGGFRGSGFGGAFGGGGHTMGGSAGRGRR